MKPYHECPRFNKCNANVCPLDPLSDYKETLEGEEVCKVEKPTRLRIGAKYPDLLRFVGYKKREFQAQERWNRVSPEKKALVLQALAKARKSLPARGIGGIVEKSATLEGSLNA